MFQRILSAYHQLTKLPTKTRTVRRSACLDVIALEERAVPAGLFATIDPPLVSVVATVAPASVVLEETDKPIVRLDLLPTCASPKVASPFEMEEDVAATANHENSDEPATSIASTEEYAEQLAEQELEWMALQAAE